MFDKLKRGVKTHKHCTSKSAEFKGKLKTSGNILKRRYILSLYTVRVMLANLIWTKAESVYKYLYILCVHNRWREVTAIGRDNNDLRQYGHDDDVYLYNCRRKIFIRFPREYDDIEKPVDGVVFVNSGH